MTEIFKRLPELTADQLKEINDCFTTYIFFSRIKKKAIVPGGVEEEYSTYSCTCTACNKSFEHSFDDEEPKHNEGTICPLCGANAIYKNKAYGKKCLYEEQRVILFCPENENAVWLRAFYASKAYNGDPCGHTSLNSLYGPKDENLTPDVYLSETKRYLLEPGNVRCFEYGYSYYKPSGWNEISKPHEPFTVYMGNGRDYWRLSKDKLENTFMRYLNVGIYHKKAQEFLGSYSLYYSRVNPYTTRFIAEFAKYPIFESLLKAGYGELVAEKIINRAPHKQLFNWEAKKLKDFFKGLSKNEIKVLKDEDYQIVFLKAFVEYKKITKKIDIDELRRDLKVYGVDDLIKLYRIVKNFNLSLVKAKNYLRKQNRKKPQLEVQIWKDYLDFAKRLKFDLKDDVVIFPKSLRTAHDEATVLVTALIREEETQKMKKLTAKLIKRYSFDYGNYTIVVPSSMQEIIDEGNALHHCVGGYAERHADGKLAILFIRDKSKLDTSYVTMEVRGKTIKQYHGYRNDTTKPLPQEVKDFVREFKLYIQNPAAYKKMKKNEEEKSA